MHKAMLKFVYMIQVSFQVHITWGYASTLTIHVCPVGNSICGSANSPAAMVFLEHTPSNMMFLCPDGAFNSGHKTSLYGFHQDPTRVTRPAYVDDYRSLPGIFLHEMMHMLATAPHIGDQNTTYTYDNRRWTGPAYGFTGCHYLANKMRTPDLAVSNADSYV